MKVGQQALTPSLLVNVPPTHFRVTKYSPQAIAARRVIVSNCKHQRDPHVSDLMDSTTSEKEEK
jgi:hypothetical protein